MALAVVDRGAGGLALRTVSALIMAPIAAGAVLLGFPYFALLVALGAGVLAWEWARLCDDGRFGRPGWVLLLVVLATVVLAGGGRFLEALALALIGSLLVERAAAAARRPAPRWLALGTVYLGVPSGALLGLRAEAGAAPVLWLFLVVWATDIGAYGAGRLIGGPRLAPRISPNKTWAGLLGGLLAAMAGGVVLGRAWDGAGWGRLIALSTLISLVSQAGDLIESAFKRHFRVKDASALIPGHGGLLDRVDGLLAAAPAMVLAQLLSGGSILAWR